MIWNGKLAAEIISKRDPQFGTSLGQTEKGIATVVSDSRCALLANITREKAPIASYRLAARTNLSCSGMRGVFNSIDPKRPSALFLV